VDLAPALSSARNTQAGSLRHGPAVTAADAGSHVLRSVQFVDLVVVLGGGP
jgi:hypothetical protein